MIISLFWDGKTGFWGYLCIRHIPSFSNELIIGFDLLGKTDFKSQLAILIENVKRSFC